MKILIVEDESIIAADLELTLIQNDYEVAGIAYDSTKALDLITNRKPDLVLLDINIKGDMNGIQIGEILHTRHQIPFIYITSYSNKDILDSAKVTMPYGYIVKPYKDKDIVTSIEIALYNHQRNHSVGLPDFEILKKHSGLSNAEYEVLKALWQGHTNQKISENIHLSINTIKTHLRNIYSKLNVDSRSEALAYLRNFSLNNK